jgi:hypothetical protein
MSYQFCPKCGTNIHGAASCKHCGRVAADVIRAHELICGLPPEHAQEFCTILRRLISGLSPEQADKALVEFFHEIEVCDELMLESCGFRKLAINKGEKR